MATQDTFISVLGFGIGEHGQLGTLSKSTQGTPTLIDHSNATFIASPILSLRAKNPDDPDQNSELNKQIEELICDLSAGGSHGAFITTHGSVYTWGGGPKLSSIPRQVVLLRGKHISHIACGALHAVAIEASRHVYQWGIVGNAISEDESTFTTPQLLYSFEHSVRKIVCGARHSLVIAENRLYTFGSNKEGQLGLGDNMDYPIPSLVTVGSNEFAVTDIAAGGEHSLCVSDGKVYSWGSAKYGQLGHGNTESKLVPTLVLSSEMDSVIESVSAGDYQSYSISKDGILFSWGRGNCGQLGNGDTQSSTTPKVVEFFRNAKEKVVEVKSGGAFQVAHAVARCENSNIYAWGSNKYHQLGVMKNQENELVPVLVTLPQGTSVHQISCGWLHTLLLVSLPFKPQKTPTQQQHSLGFFVKLPNEIILEVLKYLLDLKSLCRLSQASSSFRDLLRNDMLWEAACTATFGKTNKDIFEISWKNHCKTKFIEGNLNKYGFGNNLIIESSSQNNNNSRGIFQKIGKMIWNKKSFNIIMTGLDAAGKTTLMYYYFKQDVETTIPTIGFNVETVIYHGNTFWCWDVGGGMRLRPLLRHYTVITSAVIFMVDSNDTDRFDDAHDELWKMIELMREPEANVKILLIFANKQDLPRAAPPTEIAKRLELEKVNDIKWFIQPSMMAYEQQSMTGIHEGFAWLSRALEEL